MPLNLRHLTADSTWLITLTSPCNPPAHKAFQILIDPWLDGDSPVFHPKFSNQTHSIAASIESLKDLERLPDIVIISQDKSDHCHEKTCRQLPQEGVRVYAVPGADKTVRRWKWFNEEEVVTLKPWSSRSGGRVERIPIYKSSTGDLQADGTTDNFDENDLVAMVELSFLPAVKPWEMPMLHAAVAITYTPYVSTMTTGHGLPSPPITPPARDYLSPRPNGANGSTLSFFSSSTPVSPVISSSLSFRSARSPGSIRHQPAFQNPCPKNEFTTSIIYTPHGVPPSALTGFLQTVPLPVTLLLHCFDSVRNPWWLGGNISSGAPNALKLLDNLKSAMAGKTVSKSREPLPVYGPLSPPLVPKNSLYELGIKYWASTHDEDKELGGFVASYVAKRKWGKTEVEDEIRRSIVLDPKTSVECPANTIGGLALLELGVGGVIDLE